MDDTSVCSRCGKTAASDDLMGLCADCLLAEGLGSVADASAAGQRVRFVLPNVSEIAPLFPQLDVIEPLGCGGMGAVYKARQKNLDRFVALKILPAGIGCAPAFAARFTREAKALAKLSHTNIVTLYEFGQAGELFYFLMEYVDGVNLGQLLRSGRVSPREALAIVPQICDALQYAHDAGIVHRDIKPENILLDRKGRVKVADFGLAKLVRSSDPTDPSDPSDHSHETTHASHIMGTPQYMAPEQVAHPSDVDHRADIYSLGVVFYQMLTGELPGTKFEPPSKKVVMDVRLDEIVLRALEQKPELRYQQVSQVKTAVETIVSGRAKEPTERVPKLRWRDRWLWDYRNGIAWGSVLFVALALYVLGLGMMQLVLLVMAIYAWVGHRIQRLKSSLPPGEAQVAEGWLAWPQGMWPFNRSQGLAILHHDRLELMPVWYGGTHTIPLADITSVRQVHWVYVPLIWKYGLELELANGQRVRLAVPEPMGRRWQARLSRGKTSDVHALSEADLSAVRQQLQAPATGLMVAGALTFVSAVILAAAMMFGFVLLPLLALAEGLPDTISWRTILFMLLASAWSLPGFLVWLGARRMTRLQDRGWAMAASLVAMITPPGCLVGLPFGIWALVVLCQPKIRTAFQQQKQQPVPQAPPLRSRKREWTITAAAGVVLVATITTLFVTQSQQQVGVADGAVSPDGRYDATASAWHSMRVFGGDKLFYRFTVQGRGGDFFKRWDLPVPTGRLATNYLAQPITFYDFGQHGRIKWADDSLSVKFFVHEVEVAAYKIPDAGVTSASAVQSPDITCVEKHRPATAEQEDQQRAMQSGWLLLNTETRKERTQDMTFDIQPDGMVRFTSKTSPKNESGKPLRTFSFTNPASVRVDRITDSENRTVPFTMTREGDRVRYDATLHKVVGGGKLIEHTIEGAMSGLVTETDEAGVFEYRLVYAPEVQADVRRLELQRLPAGAQLKQTEPADLVIKKAKKGYELSIDRVIPAGRSLEVKYRYRLPGGSAPRQAAPSAALIRRVVVNGDKAIVEGRANAQAIIECGMRGVGLNLVTTVDAGSDFTAEVGYTVKSGLSLGTKRTGTGVSLSGTISNRELAPSQPFAKGRLVFRQGIRLPESDGSYFIADFHPQSGSPMPVFVRLRTANQPSPSAPEVSADLLAQPPEIRFMAWQDENPGWNDWAAWNWKAWQSDGAKVAIERDQDLLRHLIPTRVDLSGVKQSGEVRILFLWLSHPLFDAQSVCEMAITRPDGQPVPLFSSGRGYSYVGPGPDVGNHGWFKCSLAPDIGTTLPAEVNVALDYSLGPWKDGGQISIRSKGTVVVGLPTGHISGVEETRDGRTRINLVRDATKSPGVQFGFLAETKDSRLLYARRISAAGLPTMRSECFEFAVPRGDLKVVRVQTRPIQKMEIRNVSALFGHRTTPSIRLLPATQARVSAEKLVGCWAGPDVELTLAADGTGRCLMTLSGLDAPQPKPFRWTVSGSTLELSAAEKSESTAERRESLQILKLEGDSLQLRYSNGELRTLWRRAESAAPSAATSPEAFSPALALVLGGNEFATNALIDFDTGKLSSYPPGFHTNLIASVGLRDVRQASAAYLVKEGVDACGTFSPDSMEMQGLFGVALVAMPVSESMWEEGTPEWARACVSNLQAGTVTVLDTKGKVPASYVFKTREGGIGLLQITGFTREPPAVKIRYKLLGAAAQRTAAQQTARRSEMRQIVFVASVFASTNQGRWPDRAQLLAMLPGTLRKELENTYHYQQPDGSGSAPVAVLSEDVPLSPAGQLRGFTDGRVEFTPDASYEVDLQRLAGQLIPAVTTANRTPHRPFEIRLVADGPAADAEEAVWHISNSAAGAVHAPEKLFLQRGPLLDERMLSSALVRTNTPAGVAEIEVALTPQGATRFAEITRQHQGRRLAILVDGKVYMAPLVREPISGGVCIITGNIPPDEARDLADWLDECRPHAWNWEQDPDLSFAMICDSELNSGNPRLADQRKAEVHYLAYLQRSTQSMVRARVYAQLGALFSTNIDRAKGEKPDYAKARHYFRLALQEEPQRVDFATIRARCGLVTPLLTPTEKLAIRLDTFLWLHAVDEDAVRKLWLPMRPDEIQLTDQKLQSLLRLLDNVKQAEITNIVGTAAGLPDPVVALNQLITEYPGTPLAQAAQEKLGKLPKKTAEAGRPAVFTNIQDFVSALADQVLAQELKNIQAPASAERLASNYIAAINARDRARLIGLVHSRCLNGLSALEQQFMDECLELEFKWPIPEDRKVAITPVSSNSLSSQVLGAMTWRIEPTHQLQVDFRTGTNGLDGVCLIRHMVEDRGAWFLDLPLLNEDGLKRYADFKAGKTNSSPPTATVADRSVQETALDKTSGIIAFTEGKPPFSRSNGKWNWEVRLSPEASRSHRYQIMRLDHVPPNVKGGSGSVLVASANLATNQDGVVHFRFHSSDEDPKANNMHRAYIGLDYSFSRIGPGPGGGLQGLGNRFLLPGERIVNASINREGQLKDGTLVLLELTSENKLGQFRTLVSLQDACPGPMHKQSE